MTADVQRQLAEAMYRSHSLNYDVLAADLVPTVRRLIADAEKRAAAGPEVTTDGGSAGTAGRDYKVEPPTPRKDQPDPAEPGHRTTGQRRRTR